MKVFELNSITKLRYILSEDVTMKSLFENKTFEIRQPLTNKSAIIYQCQFQDFEQAEYRFLKMCQVDEAERILEYSDWLEKLTNQKVEILGIRIQ